MQEDLLIGAQAAAPEQQPWSVWLLAATARPLQPLTAMRMSGLVSISHLTRVRSQLAAASSSLRLLQSTASWRVVEYDNA
jgi:hypothetical protein